MTANSRVLALAALAVLTQARAGTAPRPAELAMAWQLDFESEPPRAVQITLPGQAQPTTFWYVRYRVTNHTGEDQIFVPEFMLYTDTGDLMRAGRRVPTAAFDAIKKILNNPLLREMTDMTGKLLQGDDNAKEGLAIWPDMAEGVGRFKVFIGGLSGESAEVNLPVPITVTRMDYNGKMETVTKDKAVLSKTLELSFSVPGEAAGRIRTPVKLLDRKWVMR